MMILQANCAAPDTTGGGWCYVDPQFSSCHDLRGPANKPWSYQACTNILAFADMTRFEMAPPHFQLQGSTVETSAPSTPSTQAPTETPTETTETTETTTSSTTEASTETTEIAETTTIPSELPAETTVPSSLTSESPAEAGLVLPQTNFVSMVGPLLPVKPAPVLRPSAEPTFDPLNFQPVSDQERDKRRPVRIQAPANTASDKKPPQNIMMRIINVVRQKLSYLNIF